MIKFIHRGHFRNTERFLNRSLNPNYLHILDKYGREGVRALSLATPKDSGNTADSWDYEIRRYNGGVAISWINTNIVNGVPVSILIQYGHGTRNGGYVQGRDYINPALRPVFDKISKEAWEEVTK